MSVRLPRERIQEKVLEIIDETIEAVAKDLTAQFKARLDIAMKKAEAIYRAEMTENTEELERLSNKIAELQDEVDAIKEELVEIKTISAQIKEILTAKEATKTRCSN